VAPPANNFIVSGTLIWLLRHLEYQNPSINLGDIGLARSMQQFRRRNGMQERNAGTEQNRTEWNGGIQLIL